MGEEKQESIVIKEYFIDITKEGWRKTGKDTTKDDLFNTKKDEFFQDITKNASADADKEKGLKDITKVEPVKAEKDEIFRDTTRDTPIGNGKGEKLNDITRDTPISPVKVERLSDIPKAGSPDVKKEKAAEANSRPRLFKAKHIIWAVAILLYAVFLINGGSGKKVEADKGPDISKVNRNIYFTLGSTQEEVKKVMGPPTNIDKSTWRYYASDVYFSDSGTVRGWYNTSRNLKVSLGDKVPNALAVKKGSSRQDVINYWGTPMVVLDSSTWRYDKIEVKFDQSGRVVSAYDSGNKKYLIR